MPANLENSAVATGLEKVSFHSNPKERQCQRMLKLLHSCVHLSSVQFSSVTQLCLSLCDHMNHSTPGLPVHHQLLEFTKTHVHRSVMPSSHLILCHPLLLLPSIFPSIRVFSNESAFPDSGGQILELQHQSV